MARITVEDCLKQVDNRFKLVLLASKRARQLSKNHALSLVPLNNDKPTVLALREIAAGYTEFKEEHIESEKEILPELDFTQLDSPKDPAEWGKE